MTTYTSVSAQTLAQIRQQHRDGTEPTAVEVIAEGGEPVRCCLDVAQPGAALLLVSIALELPPASPYAVPSPVYVHRDPGCLAGPRQEYPAAWVPRRQILRAYDGRGWIVAAREHPAGDPSAVIDAMLADPEVKEVLTSNVLHGCFMLRARRSG